MGLKYRMYGKRKLSWESWWWVKLNPCSRGKKHKKYLWNKTFSHPQVRPKGTSVFIM